MKKIFLLLIGFVVLASSALAEQVQLQTYYPAPYGIYKRLRLITTIPTPSSCNATQEGTMIFSSMDAHGCLANQLCYCRHVGAGNYQWGVVGALPNAPWSINGNNVYTTSPIYNVGIGVAPPNIDPLAKLHVVGRLKLMDGTQGNNKYLMSDANGLATWAPPPTGYWAKYVDLNHIYNTNNASVIVGFRPGAPYLTDITEALFMFGTHSHIGFEADTNTGTHSFGRHGDNNMRLQMGDNNDMTINVADSLFINTDSNSDSTAGKSTGPDGRIVFATNRSEKLGHDGRFLLGIQPDGKVGIDFKFQDARDVKDKLYINLTNSPLERGIIINRDDHSIANAQITFTNNDNKNWATGVDFQQDDTDEYFIATLSGNMGGIKPILRIRNDTATDPHGQVYLGTADGMNTGASLTAYGRVTGRAGVRALPQAVKPLCEDSSRGVMWTTAGAAEDTVEICLKRSPRGHCTEDRASTGFCWFEITH